MIDDEILHPADVDEIAGHIARARRNGVGVRAA